MLTDDLLVDLLASKDLSQRDKVLLILAFSNGTPQKLAAIREIGISHGLRRIEGWNLPRILGEAKGLAAKVAEGWKLTSDGKDDIKTKFLPENPSTIKQTEIKLRSYLGKILNTETREFVEESIKCLEANLFKSAVVMSWVGAMSLLYDYVIADKARLGAFNDRAKSSFPSHWKKHAITKDDLMLIKESQFLDILAYLSIIDPSTKKRLINFCLDLRNSCGHPSGIKIEEYTVQAHIEFLILNVYGVKKFQETVDTSSPD